MSNDDDDDDTFSASPVLFDRPPPHTGTATAMLIIDREVDPGGLLATAAKPNVVIVEFDDEKDSKDELIAKIDAAYKANGAQFKTIALANHGGEVWQLATDCKCVPGRDGYIEVIFPVMSALAKCTSKGGRIDLLGCHLLDLDPQMPDKLEQKFKGIKFTASDDKTGNPRAGGDWVMESEGDLDISLDYFDQDKLKAYNEVMWGFWDVIDFVPIVGTVARTTQAVVLAATGDSDGAKGAIANAGMNLVGDVLTVATGGASKIASASAKAGVKAAAKAAATAAVKTAAKQGTKEAIKIAFKAAVKAGSKAFIQAAKKGLNKTLKRKFINKYVKKQIKKSVKKAIKDLWEKAKEEESLPEELDFLTNAISQATGMTVDEVEQMTTNEFLLLFASIGEMPEATGINYGNTLQLVNQYNPAKGYLDSCGHNSTSTGYGVQTSSNPDRGPGTGTWRIVQDNLSSVGPVYYGDKIKLINQYTPAKGYLDSCGHNSTNTGYGVQTSSNPNRGPGTGTWQIVRDDLNTSASGPVNYGDKIKLVNQYNPAKGYLDSCGHNSTNTGYGVWTSSNPNRGPGTGTWQLMF